MLLTFKLWPKRRRNVTGSRTPPKPFLDDRQWLRIAHLFANPKPNPSSPLNNRLLRGQFHKNR